MSLDWDAWRNAYPTLTYAEQQAFHSDLYAQHPNQRHYNERLVAAAIKRVQPTTVIELGGWDGELAHAMLNQYPTIEEWTNVEVCREAARAGDGINPRYHAPILNDWYWTHTWEADLFIASHTIEHLTAEHLDRTIAATKAQALFLDAPLQDEGLTWRGSTTTHILNIGWRDVTQLCARHGYQLATATTHDTGPASGGIARACLYLKETT